MTSEQTATSSMGQSFSAAILIGPMGLSWQWLVLGGLLAFLLGIACFFFPAGALFAFTLVFAAYSLIDGLLALVTGLGGDRERSGRWWSLILRGVLGVVIGVLFVVAPMIMTVSYALVSLVLLSVWAIAGGVAEIIAAVRLRKVMKREWLLATSGLLLVLLGLGIPVLWVTDRAATLISYAWFLGVVFVAIGAVLIMLGLRLRRIWHPIRPHGAVRPSG